MQIVALALVVCFSALGCGGGSSRQMVRPVSQPTQETVSRAEVATPDKPSFAYQVALAGGVNRRFLKDIPRDQYLRDVELRHASNKQGRFSEKTIKPAGPSLLSLAGGIGAAALSPDLGAAPTAGNIAKSVGALGLAGMSGTRQLTSWEKGLLMAQVLPWLPESEAKTPTEAAVKLRHVLDQAMQGLDLGDSGLVTLPQPVLVDPPAIIVESLKYTGKVWTWANGPGIIFTASKTDPRHYKVIAAHDDVDNWQRISGKLPRWCFVFINGRIASNGQYFIGYPMVLWQGKEYYFGESRLADTALGDYASGQTPLNLFLSQASGLGLPG